MDSKMNKGIGHEVTDDFTNSNHHNEAQVETKHQLRPIDELVAPNRLANE